MDLFPKSFFWGAGTSAHQVEGGNRNDWTEYELQSAKRQAQIAHKKQWSDYILQNYPNPLQEENYISGRACDHYRRFREDFDIAKSLGHNAHRFSIEWSRIEPEEGKFDEREIGHYREIIHALRERGMEPFVTLWHWTLPLWLRDKGGVEHENFPKYFSSFVEKIHYALKDDVRFWMINEPQYWVYHAYIVGEFPPEKRSWRAAWRVYRNLLEGYRKIYRQLKSCDPHCSVGIAESMGWMSPWPFRLAAQDLRNFLPFYLARDFFDFVGINYYQKKNFWRGSGEHGNVSDLGWEIYPEGIYHIIKKAYAKFRKPIYITESGIADARDEKRAQFIKGHLYWVAQAMREGVDVRGYFYWSLLDNFEMPRLEGFWPRFGLVEVDYKTLERKIRPSAQEYKNIILQAKRSGVEEFL